MIDKYIAYISKEYLDTLNNEYYIEFILDLEDIDIFKQLKKYFSDLGINDIKIENIRLYDNMRGWFLSSYLFKDSNHVKMCSKIDEDFPGSIKCDHLYRKHNLSGEFINHVFNSNGSIFKMYKSNNSYKIYGKIRYISLKNLYNFVLDYYNKYINNLLKDNDILKMIEENRTDEIKDYVRDKIDKLILPYFQIPIGFDVVLSFNYGAKYIINLKT